MFDRPFPLDAFYCPACRRGDHHACRLAEGCECPGWLDGDRLVLCDALEVR